MIELYSHTLQQWKKIDYLICKNRLQFVVAVTHAVFARDHPSAIDHFSALKIIWSIQILDFFFIWIKRLWYKTRLEPNFRYHWKFSSNWWNFLSCWEWVFQPSLILYECMDDFSSYFTAMPQLYFSHYGWSCIKLHWELAHILYIHISCFSVESDTEIYFHWNFFVFSRINVQSQFAFGCCFNRKKVFLNNTEKKTKKIDEKLKKNMCYCRVRLWKFWRTLEMLTIRTWCVIVRNGISFVGFYRIQKTW